MGYISKEDYRKQIDEIISILEGKTDNLKKELEKEMLDASKKMEYEKAQEIRDKIFAIDRISQRQKVSNISENNIDVIVFNPCTITWFIRYDFSNDIFSSLNSILNIFNDNAFFFHGFNFFISFAF